MLQKSDKTPVPCVSKASAQTPFSVVVVPVGSTRNAGESLALWSMIQLQVETVYWTGQTSRWQTSDRGHNLLGEIWGGEIFLLSRGLLIFSWRCFYHKMPCHMRQIHWLPSSALSLLNTLRPRLNCRHFADDIFRCIFLNENEWMLLMISLKFVPKVRIENIPTLVSIMAWCRSGDKPLSEPKMVSLLTYICVTRPQWVTSGFFPT